MASIKFWLRAQAVWLYWTTLRHNLTTAFCYKVIQPALNGMMLQEENWVKKNRVTSWMSSVLVMYALHQVTSPPQVSLTPTLKWRIWTGFSRASFLGLPSHFLPISFKLSICYLLRTLLFLCFSLPKPIRAKFKMRNKLGPPHVYQGWQVIGSAAFLHHLKFDLCRISNRPWYMENRPQQAASLLQQGGSESLLTTLC